MARRVRARGVKEGVVWRLVREVYVCVSREAEVVEDGGRVSQELRRAVAWATLGAGGMAVDDGVVVLALALAFPFALDRWVKGFVIDEVGLGKPGPKLIARSTHNELTSRRKWLK